VQISEEELIRRAQRGDSDAFCLLANNYQRRVFSLALHYCRHRQDAEDLTQEVWLKAYRAINSFRGESRFYTWLRQIMINTFLNYKRATMITAGGEAAFVNIDFIDDGEQMSKLIIDRRENIEESLDKKILLAAVSQALGELTAQERFIFLLKHREGMTYDEIASALNCTAGTVKKSLFRAILKLRQHLGVKADAENLAPFATGELC
jgi:RNA polymerase sigma-70 factor, ECF subfamily